MRNRSRGKGLFSIRNLFFAAIAAQVVILSFVATTHWSAPRNEGSSSAGGLLHGARYQAAAGLLENRRAPGSQGQNRGPGEPTTGIELGQMVGDETSVCVWERPGDYDGDVRVATEPAWAKDFLLVGSCGGKKLHVAYVEESAAGWMPSTSAPPPGPPPFPTGTGGGGVRQQQGSSHNSWRYIRGAVRYGTVDHCTKPVVPHRYDVTNEPPAPCATSASHVAASPSQGVYILTLELPISGDSAAMEEGSGVWVTVQRGLSGCVVELEQASSKDENNGCKTVEGELMHSKIGSKVIKHSLGMPTSSTTSEGVGVGGEAAAKNCDTSMYRGYWGLDHEWVRTPPCVHAQPQREYPPEAPVCVLGNGKYLGPTSSTLITRSVSRASLSWPTKGGGRCSTDFGLVMRVGACEGGSDTLAF